MISNLTFSRCWFGHNILIILQINPDIQKREEQIIQKYKRGYSIQQIAKKYGVAENQIRRLLTIKGARSPRWRKMTEETRQEIIRKWLSGENNFASIARKVGISRERIRQIIQAETERINKAKADEAPK